MNQTGRGVGDIIFIEVALCWLLAMLGLAFAALSYLGSAERSGMGWVGYRVATALVVAAALLYFAAGHLEQSARFKPAVHGTAVVLWLLVLGLGRVWPN